MILLPFWKIILKCHLRCWLQILWYENISKNILLFLFFFLMALFLLNYVKSLGLNEYSLIREGYYFSIRVLVSYESLFLDIAIARSPSAPTISISSDCVLPVESLLVSSSFLAPSGGGTPWKRVFRRFLIWLLHIMWHVKIIMPWGKKKGNYFWFPQIWML